MHRRELLSGLAVVTAGIILPEIVRAQAIDKPVIPSAPPFIEPKPISTPKAPVFIPSQILKGDFVWATWYNLHGNPTATGEIMDAFADTAAIPVKKLRRFGEEFGDYAKISYPETAITLVVRLNDTGTMAGPEHPDLYLDVSEGVAIRMGWKEKGRVRLFLEVEK